MTPGIANLYQPHYLNGWKEIASYLGKAVRTVQRYERDFALPVRRPSARVQGTVVAATAAELDAWISSCATREKYPLTAFTSAPADRRSTTLNKNIEQMHQLGQRMISLRVDLLATLQRLQQTLSVTADRRSFKG